MYRKQLWFLLFLSVLFFSSTSVAAPPPAKLKKIVDCLYHGYNFLDKQQWKKAEGYFVRATILLKKRKVPTKPGKRLFHLLGSTDYRYLTGLTAEKQGKQFVACRRYEAAEKSLQKVLALSKTWRELKGLNPTLPGRMDRLVKVHESCKSVQSIVTLGKLPSNAVVQLGTPVKTGAAKATWTTVSTPVLTLKRTLAIRVVRPGYETWQRVVNVKRWSKVALKPVFKKKKFVPKPRRRPPPLSPPKPPKPTFADSGGVWWIVGGVAVVAVSTTVLILAMQNSGGVVGRVQFRAYDDRSSALKLHTRRRSR